MRLKDSVTITHLQSATQIIRLGDVKILTDPWLTEGEYYGSWYHYPPFEFDEISRLDYDYIYVSHIHPDHLSEDTFKVLPRKVPVLIHNYDSKFLKRNIENLGFEVVECDNAAPYIFENGASITIYAADNCNPELCGKFFGCGVLEKKFGSTQIDTLALFQCNDRTILNTNDCPLDLAETTLRENGIVQKAIDVLLVAYAGAGPYPQCFTFPTEQDKLEAAKAKEKQFLEEALRYLDLLKPKTFIPFAGIYILGSRLSGLTKYLGIPSMQYAIDYIAENTESGAEGVLLEQLDVYDVNAHAKLGSDKKRDVSYEEYVEYIESKDFIFDEDRWDDSALEALVSSAWERFRDKANELRYRTHTDVVIQTPDIRFSMGIEKPPRFMDAEDDSFIPFSSKYLQITLEHNLLHRLLRGPRYAHWKNAEIGSHLRFVREPNIYERSLWYCLCFFHQ